MRHNGVWWRGEAERNSALAAYYERRDASVRCLDENAFDDDAPCREDKKLFYYQPHIGQFYKPFPSCYSLVIGHWDTQSSALDIEYLPMLILDMTYKPHIARRNVHSSCLAFERKWVFLPPWCHMNI